MKKTLAALAVLGAFAGSALAADVTLYGLVDYGFSYQHSDGDAQADAEDSFTMKSGMNSGSRFGLKGTEDLGNGLRWASSLKTGLMPMTARSIRTATTGSSAAKLRSI